MKISAFNPLIVTKDAKAVTELFEALGFEHAHTKTGINETVTNYDMKNPDGFRVDIAQVDQLPQEMTVIRMTVRDFDEAYNFLTEHGFKNAQGEKVTETGSSKATLMVSPSGFAISLAQHIKKDKE
jgi:glutaminase